MKRIKIGVAIVCIIGVIYCIVSYSIFLYKKSSIDAQIQQKMLSADSLPDQQHDGSEPVVALQGDGSVVIQKMNGAPCSKHQCASDTVQPDFIVTDDDHDEPVAELLADEQPQFFVSADNVPAQSSRKAKKSHSYSFITMNISDDYVMDQETQDALDVLIGDDVDAFVKLILQSNNDIVSKEACRSCGMYAFFNGIKNHKQLTSDEVRILQKMLANVYRFVGKMQKLNKNVEIIDSAQYKALQQLHASQAVKDDLKLQARKSATAAALKKLQNIKYNK